MSGGPDFAAAMAHKIEADWEVEVETVHPHQDSPHDVVAVLAWPGEIATSATEAKVPELCPCVRFDGMVPGHMRGSNWDFVPCDHREAPTIARLLAIGAAVWTGVRDGDVRLTATERERIVAARAKRLRRRMRNAELRVR